LLYRHLLQSLTASPTALTALPKARVIHESSEPITGLGFRESTTKSEASQSIPLSLFIVTVNRILSVLVSGKGGEPRLLDETGCGLGCAALNAERSEMIMARDEAIQEYGPDGHGPSYTFEGKFLSISAPGEADEV